MFKTIYQQTKILESFIDRREKAARLFRRAAEDARKDGKMRMAEKYGDKAEMVEESLEGYG